MIKRHCANCSQPVEFPPDLAGREAPCPACGKTIRLTGEEEPFIRIPKPTPATVAAAPEPTPVQALAGRIRENIERVVVGKHEEITLLLVAYLAEGHVLIQDVPGVAKTMLARALARCVESSFKRIQCTPDLLPSDITGSSIFNPKTTEFEFRPGPLFAQVVLADEINRATPRAQSALLEAMAEGRITADGSDYGLERPFLLIATQNPIDHEGTFPLPEAQLDRFLIRLSLGYPRFEEEKGMLQRLQLEHPIESLEPVTTAAEVAEAQQAVRQTYVDELVCGYIVSLIQATRDHHDLGLGGSPRASISLFRCAQAYAAIRGDDFVQPDDVKAVAPAVLQHRLILRPESRLRRKSVEALLVDILNDTPVPHVNPTGSRR